MSETEAAPPSRKSSTAWLAAIALVVTFITGVFVGGVGGRLMLRMHPERRLPPPRADFLVKRLDRALDLTPQQEADVTRIIRTHHERMDAVWSGVRPQIRREVEETNAEIERVLNPEQRAKFAKLKMRLMPREGRGSRPPRR